MAETVGQHSVAAFTSPVNGTTPIDANTVRGNDNTVRSAYVDHDADPGIHVQSSSLASRPVAGTVGRKWITVNSGRYQLWYDDGSRWHEVASDAVNVDCLADANLTKGDVVKITGFNNGQNLPTVNKVSASTDTAFGIVENTVTSGNIVQIVNTGLIEDVDTNGYAVGTILYPNSSGGFTTTKPTSGNYQPAGYVLRGNTNNGVLYVEFSAPRIVERSDNTASTIVLRDASGNFSAGTITAGALTSTGLVTFASLKGTGATTVTNILDEDNMASDSATALATQQSIKAYVDAKVATVDTLAEVLANGNTTGANDIIVNAGQKIRTPLIASQNNATAITIADTTGALTFASALADSNLATISTAGKVANSATTATSANTASAIVARDSSGNFSAGTITAALTGNASTATTLQTARNINGVSFNGSADITVTAAAGTLTGTTLASGVTASSLTSVGTLTSLTVSGDLTVDTNTLYVKSSSNQVSIGTTNPTAGYQLDVIGRGRFAPTASNYLADFISPESNGTFLQLYGDNSEGALIVNGTAAKPFGLYVGGSRRLQIDASGNLGLGVTPSAWGASYKAMQVGARAGFLADANGTYVTNNFYNNGTSSLYIATDAATLYYQASGQHLWYTAPSGTAGTAISFTQAMTLDTTTYAGYSTLTLDNPTNGSVVSLKRNNSLIGQLFVTSSEVYLESNGAYPVLFRTNATERARIDASGNLGVGTASPTSIGGYKTVTINGTTGSLVDLMSNGTVGGRIQCDTTFPGLALYAITNNPMVFGTNATERARITSGGLFVAGATSSAGVATRIGLSGPSGNTSDADLTLGSDGSVAVIQSYNGKSLSINAAGNKVGIGASSPLRTLDVRGAQVLGSGATLFSVISRALAPSGSQGFVITASVNRDEATTLSGVTSFADNSSSGATIFLGGNAADQYGGSVDIIAYGSGVDGNLITFSNRSGAGTTTERARITSGGYFKASNDGTYVSSTGTYHELRQTANDYAVQIRATNASYTSSICFIVGDRTTTNATYNLLTAQNGNGTGQIIVRDSGNVVNTNGSYGTISDERLKQDIVDAGSQWDDIKAVRFRKYRMKAEVEANPDAPHLLGVVAQELEQTSPGLVDEDAEGTKSVKSSILLMKAAVALQEAMARIEALEARLEALEA